jgi:superfamily II DNA or RNA helicase
MWIEVHNLRSKLIRATDEERHWLEEYLTFSEGRFARRKDEDKARYYTKQISLFDGFRGSFPTGLLPLVRREAAVVGHPIEIANKRERPCERDPSADLAWLRDYQLAAVDAVCKHQRGLIKASTGSGKGEVIIGLTKALPCQWLFLVHRTSLVEQQAERYEARTGLRAGRIGEGQWSIPEGCQFVCASFQSLYAGLRRECERTKELLEWAQGIAVDECHCVAADTLYAIAMATHNAFWRCGFSGTPLARGDKRSMFAIGALGRIIHEVKTEFLVEKGVLAKPKIRLVAVEQTPKSKTWQGVYHEAIVRSVKRNHVIVDMTRKAKKPCLVFVKEIAHGKLLEREILRAGIQCGFVWGTHSTDSRRSAIRRLVSGHIEVLICSVVFQEGIDIPELESVIVASAGKSIIATLQRIGRGMRVAKNKSDFEVWDVFDEGCGCNGEEHGGCKWLERHTRERIGAYTSEGHETVVLRTI